MKNKGNYRGVDYVTGRFVYGGLSLVFGEPMIEIPAGLVALKDNTLEKYNEATKNYEKVTTWKIWLKSAGLANLANSNRS